MKGEYNVKFRDEDRRIIETVIVGAENVMEAKRTGREIAAEMGIRFAYIQAHKGIDRNAYERAQRKRRADPAYENAEMKNSKIQIYISRDMEKKIAAISALTGAKRNKIVYEPLKRAIDEVYNSLYQPNGSIRQQLSFKKPPHVFIAHVENAVASLDFDEETDYPYHVYVRISDEDFERIKEVFEKK